MNYPSEHQEPLAASERHNSGVVGLAAGTLVMTPDGEKKIEEVKAGDLVLSGVGDGLSRYCEVEEATAKPYRGPMLRIESNPDYQLRATPNHICFGFPHDAGKIESNILLFAFS